MIVRDTLGTLNVVTDGPGWERFWTEDIHGPWHEHLLHRLSRMRWTPNDVLVDIGAWVGPISLYAARLGVSVIAIEPDPIAYAALVRNVALNGLQQRITTICAAITAETRLFGVSPNSTGAFGDSSTYISDGDAYAIPVAGFTLPDLLEKLAIPPSRVAFVKIDVEGYESELMPTLEPWLHQHSISYDVETHPLAAT